MRNRSPANSAASSPPVPARISRMAFFSSAASLGSSRMLDILLQRLDALLELRQTRPRPAPASRRSVALSASIASRSASSCSAARSRAILADHRPASSAYSEASFT